jgi:cytochrome c553
MRSFVAAAGLAAVVFGTADAADLDAGKALYAGCVGCHGEPGLEAADLTPALEGQLEVYLQSQLVSFRTGHRRNDTMNQIAEALSDDDIRNLGAYLASLPPTAAPSASRDDKAAGLVQQFRCTTCHGPNFEGKAGAPRLAGQREDYLLQTLRDLKSGARAAGLVSMADVLAPVDEADLPALAHFVATTPATR